MSTNTFDLWSATARANPRPVYARIREQGIVRLVRPDRQLPFWLVGRHADVVALLRDPRLAKDPHKLDAGARQRVFQPSQEFLTQHLLVLDPPDHTRLRALVSQAFTPRRVESLKDRVTAHATELLDALDPGCVEFVENFAFPLPFIVIAELLGVPIEDRGKFRAWTEALFGSASSTDREGVQIAAMSLVQYFIAFIERRRHTPADDLVSALISAERDDDRMTTRELVSMLFLLLIAGHDTTMGLLSGGLLALIEHPEQLARLRQDRGLMRTAIEEMLRYCSPVETSTGRFTVEAIELCGQPIPAGEMIVAGLLSANHDPTVFAEPDVFDISRALNPHVAFGSGVHFCLGATLARLEASVALELILDRAPRPRLLVESGQLRWRESTFIRAPLALPVAFL